MARRSGGWKGAACTAAALLLAAVPAAAQKDYYNLDRHRPVRIEDAAPTERYAVEVRPASLRLERDGGGRYRWEVEPEVAYGLLPRTSVEVGLPFAFADDGPGAPSGGLAGVELSAFHALNTETRTLPALALRGGLSLPAGTRRGESVRPSLTGIATRTFTAARIHLNGGYTFGDATEREAASHGEARWLAGVALDRAFPLDAYLLVADLYAERPLHDGAAVEWSAGAGLRYQLGPSLTVDAGLSRRLTGAPVWSATFGTAYHFGVRSLIPGLR